MKTLTALEITAVIKELQPLIKTKVAKIYQPTKEELAISFHKANEGRIILRIIVGQCLYLSSYKKPSPKEQFGFCRFLRKRLHNSILTSIEQKNFERIVEFTFQTKEEKFLLIVELFSKGNVILCNKDYTIISAMQVQLWKDRKIKAMEIYKYPPQKGINPLTCNYEQFKAAIKSSTKESIVKTLAIEFGLGGIYSEEVCQRGNIEKHKKELTEEELKRIFSAIEEIRKLEIKANIGEEDVFPFEMQTKKKVKEFGSYNEALDHFYSKYETREEEKAEEDLYAEKIKEQETILKNQEEQLNNIKTAIEENKEKGDLIYKNYSFLKEVFEVIKKARDRKISWEEIAEKLKTKGIMVNYKEGKITLELK